MCKVDGNWTSWADWSKCKAEPCQLGNQWRSRACEGSKNGGRGCVGVTSQQKQCRNDCPGSWTDWSDCNVECGIGIRRG